MTLKMKKVGNGASVLIMVFILMTVQGCVSKKRFLSTQNEKETLSDQLKSEGEINARLLKEKRETEQRLAMEQEKRVQLQQEKELDNQALQAQMQHLEKSLSEKNNKLSELETRLGKTANKSAQLENQLAHSQKTAAEKIQDAEEMLRTQEELIGSLKQEIDDGNIKISKMNDRLSVQIVSKILFPSGSDRVTGEGEAVLKKVSNSLKSIKQNKIQIEGHTDNIPIGPVLAQKFPSNWELSTARATQVVRLLAREEVDPTNMLAAGMAEFAPVASNDTPEGRQQNRRIEIVLIPK